MYHSRAVAQSCVNGDRLSQWRMAQFDPLQFRNPWTDIDTKFETAGDYIRETNLCAKFRANPSIGGYSANGWNITKIFLRYIYLFCWWTYRSDRPADFHVWLGQRGLTQRSNFFGNPTPKLISNPRKIPPKWKIRPKNGRGNFQPKTLLNKNCTYIRPLIVIVGP